MFQELQKGFSHHCEEEEGCCLSRLSLETLPPVSILTPLLLMYYYYVIYVWFMAAGHY